MFDEEIILHNAKIFLDKIHGINPFIYAEVKELYDVISSFHSLPAPSQDLIESYKNQKIESLAVVLHTYGVSIDKKN